MAAIGLRTRLLRQCLAVLCAATASAVPALAEQATPPKLAAAPQPIVWAIDRRDINSIVAADNLRSLGQQIDALGCHMAHDVAGQKSRADLRRVALEFSQYVGVLDGATLGPADVLSDLRAVKDLWSPLRRAIITVSTSETAKDPTAMSLVTAGSDVLVPLIRDLSDRVRGSYAAQTLSERRILASLDVVGQQAVLTQEISKTACDIWAGDRSSEKIQQFIASTWMLTEALAALRHGQPSMGLMAPPTSAISRQLDGVIMDWRSMKLYVDGMMEKDIPIPAKRLVFDRLNGMTAKLGQIAQLYAAQSQAYF